MNCNTTRHHVFILTLLLASGSLTAYGAGGGGGGFGGGGFGGGDGLGGQSSGNNVNPNNPNPFNANLHMVWQDSLAAAVEAAKVKEGPVMAVVFLPTSAEQQKKVDTLVSYREVIWFSNVSLKAVKITDPAESKDLLARANLKTGPAVIWLDHYGNILMTDVVTISGPLLTGMIRKWPNTLCIIDKYFQKHIANGEKYLSKDMLHEAYNEFSIAASYQGPQSDKAREKQTAIKNKWLKLAEEARRLPATSPAHKALVNGLRKDVAGLNCAAAILDAVTKPPAPVQVAEAPTEEKPKSAGPSKTAEQPKTPEVAVAEKAAEPPAPPPPAASPPPPAAPPAAPQVENTGKLLAQAAQGPVAEAVILVKREPAILDTRLLESSKDEGMKNASKLIQEALAGYNKAGNMERGEPRNKLLHEAHDKFDDALSLIEKATGDKTDAPTEKLMERVSMMMYCCMKYSSV